MKPEIAKLWVDALRSGEYKQAQESLRKENSFCCLGVLCDLHAKAHNCVWETGWSGYYYLGRSADLPLTVATWAGLSSTHGVRLMPIQNPTLTVINDDGAMFDTIANIIEAEANEL